VKTVWEGKRDVQLHLSAAARLGKSSLPSFLCILEISEEKVCSRLHVLHMSGPLLERVLQKLREMQASGQSTRINKVDFRVPIPKAGQALTATGSELRRSIEVAVGPAHAAYRREKDAFLQNSGFPTNPLTGTMSVRAESPVEFSDFLLGRRSLPIVALAAAVTRWGISIPLQLETAPATVRAIPRRTEVEVVWRRVGAIKSVRWKMQAILAPGADKTGQRDRWLITHPNLELLLDGTSYEMILKGPDATLTSYQTLCRLHALEELLAADGEVDVQMFLSGRLMLAWRSNGTVQLRPPEQIQALGWLLQDLGVVLAEASIQDITIPPNSWDELENGVSGLRAMLKAPTSITATLDLTVNAGSTLDVSDHETLYVTAIDFGDSLLAYYATCRGRLEPAEAARLWRMQISDFVVREIRLVERSDEAMEAFAMEAEALTGLTTRVLTWGAGRGR
jgi:hypothetical protein